VGSSYRILPFHSRRIGMDEEEITKALSTFGQIDSGLGCGTLRVDPTVLLCLRCVGMRPLKLGKQF